MPLYLPLQPPTEPQASDHGFKCWNYDPGIGNSSLQPVAGTLYFHRLYPRATITVSSLWTLVGTAGATLTNVGFALYTAAGALLASSVNANGAVASLFQTSGPRQVTFTTPQVMSAPFYAAYWFTGTTTPAFGRMGGANATFPSVGLAAPNLRNGTANTGLTTAAPATLGTMTAEASVRWIAAA